MNERVRNLSGAEQCRFCDDGLALVSTRPGGIPEYGPCPYCELGARLEFPTGKPGPHGERGAKPSWGREGYWQGRDPEVTAPPRERGLPLSHAENALRARLLIRRAAGETVDPAVGIDIGDREARMRLLAQEAAR